MHQGRAPLRVFNGFTRVFGLLGAVAAGFAPLYYYGVFRATAAEPGNAPLQIFWEASSDAKDGAPRLLREETPEKLVARKRVSLSEPDPSSASRAVVRFEGPSLAALVEDATREMPATERANADLVVVRSRDGREAYLPKAFLVKYPRILLALRREGGAGGADLPRLVLPVSSSPKIRAEGMLLEPHGIAGVGSITLTSYRRRFGDLFLVRRSDPSAMRGEKIFVQNCASCHSGGRSPLAGAEARAKAAPGSHPEVPGATGISAFLDTRSSRAITSYLEAYRAQSEAANAER